MPIETPWHTPTPDLDRSAAGLAHFDRWMAATPWWQYRRIDADLRRGSRWTPPDWFPDWPAFGPRDVEALARRSARPGLAGELLSMHTSGYVREAAVRLLGRVDAERALPLLMVRTGDWVGSVRDIARATVRARLQRPGWPEWGWAEALPTLPLLEQMAGERTRSERVAIEVIDHVRSVMTTSQLLGGLRDGERRPRRACARLLVARGEAAGDVLAAALAQDDMATVALVARAALAGPGSPDPDVVAAIWPSPAGSLRAEALHRAQVAGLPEARAMSDAGLLDHSPSVRSVAQAWLAGQGIDLRRTYEEALPAHVVALRGLAEVAGSGQHDEVAAVAEPYLVDERHRAREAAVHVLAAVRGAAARAQLLAMLDDPRPAVVRAVGRVLAPEGLDAATLDALWEQAVMTDRPVVRQAALWAFRHQSRWPRLVIACRALTTPAHEDVRRWGDRLLRRTRETWSTSSTRVTAVQREELDRLVPVVADGLPAAEARDLRDLYRRSR